MEKANQDDNEKISLPYSTTLISDQFLRLKKFNHLYPSINFLIGIIAIFGSFFWITLFAGIYDDAMFYVSIMMIFIILLGPIVLLIVFIAYRGTPAKLMRSIFPQRTMPFFDLYPDTEGCNPVEDVYLRLRYILLLNNPKFKEDGTGFEKPKFKKPKKTFNKTFKKNKVHYKFEVFRDVSNDLFFTLYYIFLILIIFPFLLTVLDVAFYYDLSSAESSLYLLFLLIVFILFYEIFYFLFYKREMVIVKHIKDSLTTNDIKGFKESINAVLRWKTVPLISVILTDKDVSSETLEYAQSNDALIKDEYPITIVQKTSNGFKLIWTG